MMEFGEPSIEDRKKFDVQLSQSHEDVKRLCGILGASQFRKIELKSEQHQWERTGNICIELMCGGEKSGILATEADYWFHELKPYGIYLMFPRQQLRDYVASLPDHRIKENAGDHGKSVVALVSLGELLNFKKVPR